MPDTPPGGDPEVIAWLWRRAAAHRGERQAFDPLPLMREARDEGVPVGWREVVWLLERDARSEPWTASEFVLDFLRRYLGDRDVDWIVDPCVTTPTLLPALLDAGVARRGAGFVRQAGIREIASLTAGVGDRLGWHDEWRVPLLPDWTDAPPLGHADLIVSMPPAGMKVAGGGGRLSTPDGKEIVVRDDLGHLAVLNALELAPGGEAIFLLPNSFLMRRDATRVRTVLRPLGLYVHAAVNVQQATRATGIPFTLVFIRRDPIGDVFIGQLTPQVDRGQLIRNIKRRSRGPVPALGRLTAWADYTSFEDTVARERLDRLVAKVRTSMQPLRGMLIEDVAGPPRKPGARLEASSNTVYLPTFLNATCHFDVEATSGKASGYYRLALDPTKALAEYVSAMFNSDLGRGLRRTWASGGTMASVRLSALRSAEVPLPDIGIQLSSVRTLTRIRNVRAQLDELEGELAEHPRDAARIGRRLLTVGQADPLVPWIQALPFPLASILWRYRADANPAAKVEHLLRFFEATAEFFVTVLLSAFASDADMLNAEKGGWLGGDGNSLHRATFGNWTHLGAALAASTRRLLSKPGTDPDRARMRAAFGVQSDALVEAISGKELWKLLDRLLPERNDDAHSGIRSKNERAQKLLRLEDSLTELRLQLADALPDTELVKPGAGARRGGVSTYEVAAVLTGPNQIFRQARLKSLAALDDELYIVDVTDEPLENALQLLPLVRLRAAPEAEENACYFYNRLNGGEAEFVSHHFAREARISEDDPELVAFLDMLQAPVEQ
jgi:hypothetical protein